MWFGLFVPYWMTFLNFVCGLMKKWKYSDFGHLPSLKSPQDRVRNTTLRSKTKNADVGAIAAILK